jgi:hypothetical protein
MVRMTRLVELASTLRFKSVVVVLTTPFPKEAKAVHTRMSNKTNFFIALFLSLIFF